MSNNVSSGFAAAILGPHAFDQIFLNGVFEVRSGDQPATADAAPPGALLGYITRDGGTFAHGNPANGLQFARAGRFAIKEPTHTWKLVGIATGTAGWLRLLGNRADSGMDSLDDPRIDGAIGPLPSDEDPATGDFQMRLPTLDITDTTAIEIGQWFYAIPPI